MALDTASIGSRIKHFRTKHNMSQEQLSERISTTRKHISKIEIGDRAPSLELLILIANALDVSADDLLADNLKHTSSTVGKDLHTLLMDCNHDEREMLLRLLRFMKALFLEFNI